MPCCVALAKPEFAANEWRYQEFQRTVWNPADVDAAAPFRDGIQDLE
jgi:hypothetical protein